MPEWCALKREVHLGFKILVPSSMKTHHISVKI